MKKPWFESEVGKQLNLNNFIMVEAVLKMNYCSFVSLETKEGL